MLYTDLIKIGPTKKIYQNMQAFLSLLFTFISQNSCSPKQKTSFFQQKILPKIYFKKCKVRNIKCFLQFKELCHVLGNVLCSHFISMSSLLTQPYNGSVGTDKGKQEKEDWSHRPKHQSENYKINQIQTLRKIFSFF